MRFQIEYTDTFCGEANYSWVKRETLDVADNIRAQELKRKAKDAMGLSGTRGLWSDYGDTIAFKPRGMCTIMFVTVRED